MDKLKRYAVEGWEWESFDSDNGSWCLSSDVEKLEAELAGLRDGAFQAHEQHDADQAEIARLTAELTQAKAELRTVCKGMQIVATALGRALLGHEPTYTTDERGKLDVAVAVCTRVLTQKEEGK